MSENISSLPAEEMLQSLEHVVSRFNLSVTNGAEALTIPDDEVRTKVLEKDIRSKQSESFQTLLIISEKIDWQGIVDAERDAREECSVATELFGEAKQAANSEVTKLDESLTIALRVAPDIGDEIESLVAKRKEAVQQDTLLPAEQLLIERQQELSLLESMFERAGQAWMVPNLTSPDHATLERYATATAIYDSSTIANIAKAADLSDREKKMLDILMASVQPDKTFRQADIDFDTVEFVSTDSRRKAFGLFARKLTEANVLNSQGKRGGKRYLLNSLVSFMGQRDAVNESPADRAPVEVEPTVIDVVDNQAEKEDELKLRYIKCTNGSRVHEAIEGDFEDLIGHLGVKDPEFIPILKKWIKWLQDNPHDQRSIKKLGGSFKRSIKGEDNVIHRRLQYRFAAQYATDLETGKFTSHRVIFARVDGQIAISAVVPHDRFDRM